MKAARPLERRCCMITGASGSFGSALARAYWAAGASLILTGRSIRALEHLKEELLLRSEDSQQVTLIPADLSVQTEVDRLIAEISSTIGEITVLVNNAAVQGPIGNLWENDRNHWLQTVQLNLAVPLQLCAGVIPAMLKRHYGKIINISGGGATSSRPRFSAYAASKAALVRVTEVLADETKDTGIDVNAIAPGAMNTRMTEEVVQSGPERAGLAEYLRAKAQQQTQADATRLEAANLAVFLASADSDGITGRLVSAVWDPWREMQQRWKEIEPTDIYTLRRITPKDRGRDWDKQ